MTLWALYWVIVCVQPFFVVVLFDPIASQKRVMDVIVTMELVLETFQVYMRHYIIIGLENCIDVSAKIPGAQKCASKRSDICHTLLRGTS